MIAATLLTGAVALGGLVLLARGDMSGVVMDADTVSSTEPADPSASDTDQTGRTTIEVGGSGQPIRFELPVDPVVSDVFDSAGLSEFRIEDGTAEPGRLAVLVLPADEVSTVEDSIGWLEGSLSQAVIESTDQLALAGTNVTRVRMSVSSGMELAGFRFGPNSFLSAPGSDRTDVATFVQLEEGTVGVVWVDANDASIDVAVGVADVVAGSITTTN